LQAAGLCHRNLSLDSIQLNGDHADIARLEWCLRYNKNAPKNEDSPLPVPGGANPQYVAPEYFGFTNGVWDGFAADLWAVGLMLYSMVVSSEALFTAPIPEDRVFFDVCTRGRVGELAAKYGKRVGKSICLSDDLVDLLQKMLKSDPKERISLDEILEHPWVTNVEVSLPSKWMEARKEAVDRGVPKQTNDLDVSIRENNDGKNSKWLDEEKSNRTDSS
jgi:serine/threonine protein kinase